MGFIEVFFYFVGILILKGRVKMEWWIFYLLRVEKLFFILKLDII